MTGRSVTYFGSFLLAAVLAVGLARPVRAYGETHAYELCIEQSPAKAGKVTPDSGTHRFSANAVVALSAEPQPGYRFVYWLGDVADPGSKQTTVQVDATKVVVAVFQPEKKDALEERLRVGGGGGGPLVPTSIDLQAPACNPAAGGGRSRTNTVIVPVIVTPEPATILMLAFGALALRRRRRQPRLRRPAAVEQRGSEVLPGRPERFPAGRQFFLFDGSITNL